jgi:hypothetical protein
MSLWEKYILVFLFSLFTVPSLHNNLTGVYFLITREARHSKTLTSGVQLVQKIYTCVFIFSISMCTPISLYYFYIILTPE